MFAAMWLATRETDLIGWFRQNEAIAALLVEGVGVSEGTPEKVAVRVRDTVAEALSPSIRPRLRVRVRRLQSAAHNASVAFAAQAT
jgi:hypothetical protein